MRFFGVFAVLMGLTGHVNAKDIRVAVDIAPVHSIVAYVLGDVGELNLIVPVGASPHDHAMRPSEAYNLSKADVVIWIGEGLTPWLEDPIETLAPDAQHIELMHLPETIVLPFREGAGFGAHSHGDHEGHSGDEGHKDGDPHVWLDPVNAIYWAGVIAKALSEEMPSMASVFQRNAKAFATHIADVQVDLQDELRAVQGRAYIVFHDGFHGFEHRFEVEAVGAISDSDAAAPSPSRVAQVRDLVKSQNVNCVLAEPLSNRGLVEAVAMSARVGEVDPIGAGIPLGADLYEGLLRSISETLIECLAD